MCTDKYRKAGNIFLIQQIRYIRYSVYDNCICCFESFSFLVAVVNQGAICADLLGDFVIVSCVTNKQNAISCESEFFDKVPAVFEFAFRVEI